MDAFLHVLFVAVRLLCYQHLTQFVPLQLWMCVHDLRSLIRLGSLRMCLPGLQFTTLVQLNVFSCDGIYALPNILKILLCSGTSPMVTEAYVVHNTMAVQAPSPDIILKEECRLPVRIVGLDELPDYGISKLQVCLALWIQFLL